MLYGDWIGRWGQSHPDKLALIDEVSEGRVTYGELADGIHRMAHFLVKDLRVCKGDRITILSNNRREFIDLFFAAGRIGAILVPLNIRLAPKELLYLLNDSTPVAFFYEKDYLPVMEMLRPDLSVRHYVCLDSDTGDLSLDDCLKGHPTKPPDEVDMEASDPHLIIYTSGTTGVPKGAILTHGMITWNSFNTIIGWELRSDDSAIIISPMFYTGGWNVFTLPLFHCRGTNILIKNFDADLVLNLIKRERVTLFFGVPTMFKMMFDSPLFHRADLSSIRFLVSGAAPCPREYFEIFKKEKGLRLWEGYGLTEVGPNNFLANGKIGTLGHPMFHVDFKVVDDRGKEVKTGELGEIVFRGEHVCGGYWKKSEATAESIRNGWFYTGDTGKVDHDGHVSIVGRKKDMIISGGSNIYPAEIERVIEAHPDVLEVAVIGVPDPKWGEVGKAIVVTRPERSPTAQEIIDFCKERLGRWKIPKYVTFTDFLPRTAASNKVQKFILKERFGRAE